MSLRDMQEQQHSTEKIQEVANVITGIDLHLALEAVMQLKRSLSLELNFVRNRQQAQEREFREFMNELWKTLSNIQAQFRIDATLLHLIKPEEAGEQKCQGKRNSNRSRMLDGFAKSGS